MNEKATKESWKNQAIDHPKRIAIDLHLTDKQFRNSGTCEQAQDTGLPN